MFSTILIVDPKGVILGGGQQVVTRHGLYSEALSVKTQNLMRLRVLSRSVLVSELDSGVLEDFMIVVHGNILKYTMELLRIVKKDKTISAIVVGDPWESFVIAKMCLLLSSRDLPIQVQIHADIGERQWKKIQPRNLIKYYFAKFSLPFANQIRTVSGTQTRKLLHNFRVRSNQIVIIPVVSSTIPMSQKSSSKIDSKTTIGLVGRIEIDRGLDFFLDVVSKLIQTNFHFKVLVIGSGSKSIWLKKNLESLVGSSNVEMTGWLQGAGLIDRFAQIDVLVSVAQSESYGRAIREAISLGLSVLTTQSSGVDDLLLEQKNLKLSVLSGMESGMDLVEIMEKMLKSPYTFNSETLILDEGIYVESLITSWINLSSRITIR
jgi:glycosyltransferase involved in cell wall biosynthesis